MSSIRKRGENYTVTAYLGYNDQGRQIRKTTTFRPPKGVSPGKAEKLALAYAITWEQSVKGYVALDENRTFAELADWYYSTVAPAVLRESVLVKNRRDIALHVTPKLGREKLKNITPATIDALLRELQLSGNLERCYRLKDPRLCPAGLPADVSPSTLRAVRSGKPVSGRTAAKVAAALGLAPERCFVDCTERKGLSGASANRIKQVLSAIFTAAVKKEIMLRNPCTYATSPKSKPQPAAFLNEEQSRLFLRVLRGCGDFQFEVFCSLLLATGIRPGECVALHWEDVDLDRGVLYVRATVVRTEGRSIRHPPKTPQSERRIVLPAYVTGLLASLKERQAGRPNLHGSVFCNYCGDYASVTNMNSRLKRVIRGSGLPETLHLHTLRHTHASLLINNDISAKVVSDRLGHSNTGTTLNIYSHVFAANEVKAMQAVEMSLFPLEPARR